MERADRGTKPAGAGAGLVSVYVLMLVAGVAFASFALGRRMACPNRVEYRYMPMNQQEALEHETATGSLAQYM